MPQHDRRTQLLQAAGQVFVLRGLKSATVEEITTRAGVAKGTFYLYFDSREAALAALGEQLEADLLRAVEQSLKRKNRAQGLADFLVGVVEFRVANAATAALHPRPAAGSPVLGALTRFLAEGSKAGDFDIRNPQATATLLYGGVCAALAEGGAGTAAKVKQGAEELSRGVLARRHKKK